MNRRQKRLLTPRDWFEAAVRKAGVSDFSWHCLRHTFASRLVMLGVDIRQVQLLIGHKAIQLTARYSHLSPEHQLAAVEKLCETGKALESPTDTRTDTDEKQRAVDLEPVLQ